MSVFTGIRKLFTRSRRKGISFHYINREDVIEARRIYGDSVGDGMTSDVIMSPVLWAARRMAESPIGVRKIDDEEIDFDHDAAKLLKRPNEFYSGSAFRMALCIEFLLDGNGYAIKIRNGMLKPIGLSFIPHWLIEPHDPGDGGYIDYYEYTPGGRGRLKILPEDIIHIRNGIDPSNIRKGLSPLKILLREIYTDDEAAIFTAMMLKNGGVPGMVISPTSDGAWVEDIALEKKRVMEEFSGLRKGNPMVMRGPTKVEHYGFDAAKLDLSALREIPEERVTALLGIPAAVVGFGTGLQQTKVGATMAEMRTMAYEDCIIPMQQLWSDEWDLQLLPEFEGDKAKNFRMIFDLSNVRVLRDDEDKKAERLRRDLNAGGITLAEWRQERGYDVGPEHDIYYLPFSTVVVPAAQIGTPEPAAPAASPPKSLPAPRLKARADRNTARLMHSMLRDHAKLSRRWTSQLRKYFDELGSQAASAWEMFASDRGIKSMKDVIDDPLAWAILLSQELDYTGFDYAPQYLSIGKSTYGLINAILGLDVNLEAPAEARILNAAGTRKGLIDLAQQTKDALFDAISEGREAGMGPVELAGKIKDMVSAGPWGSSETRAMVIARTETKYAQNVSSLEAYKGMDGATGIRVFDAQLGPTDEECEERNGTIVSFEEAERMIGSEHPNGTLSLSPYMGEMP